MVVKWRLIWRINMEDKYGGAPKIAFSWFITPITMVFVGDISG